MSKSEEVGMAQNEQILGAYRHINEYGHGTKIQDNVMTQHINQMQSAKEVGAMPPMEIIAYRIAKALERMAGAAEANHSLLLRKYGQTPELSEAPKKADSFDEAMGLFQALEKLGIKVKVVA